MKKWPALKIQDFSSSRTLLQASRAYIAQESSYELSEVLAISKALLAKQSQLSQAQLMADYPLNFSEEQRAVYIQRLFRIARHEPIQYVLGETFFLGRSFWLNSSVLIPRPETEELTQKLLDKIPQINPPEDGIPLRGLDLGTGSACIAISLAKELPQIRMSGLDISSAALQLAYWNAWRHQLRLEWIQDNLLNTGSLRFPDSYWDFMVSNPPYVLEQDRKAMHPNVLEYEPAQALFVPDDRPLLFYEAILKIAASSLKPGGLIAWEIHEKMGVAIAQLLQEAHYRDIRIEKDMFGQNRFAFAQKAD